MTPHDLQSIFQAPFNYTLYSQEIVHRLFGCNDVEQQPYPIDTSTAGDLSHYVGQMEDSDGRLLGFFYTRVAEGSDVRRKRVGLRKLIQPYLRYEVDAAIAVFDDGQHWRLSYICDHKDNITAAKRFSYILGDEKGQYKTPRERLEKVADMKGHFKLSDLKAAFSVETLSDEFFKEYHNHYDNIVSELARQGKTGAVFHDYVKKMMGRIVFLHFLQKKGWLNDNPAFLRDLFFFSPYQTDFLEQVLEPLFFGIFNTETEQRERLFDIEHWDKGLLKQWENLPYLNGGLFERDEVDKVHIKLPASLFEKLFEFMSSYNFTVDENDPDDADIGIDPEMLGKIFESLLEDNKSKGAFYTPKEIVRYMCKESLIAYLDSKLETSNASEKHNLNNPIQESKQLSQCGDVGTKGECVPEVRDLKQSIRAFVEQHEQPEELEPYRDILDRALREVKICDPAIGSGAFPMGLLNELWRCREALMDAGNTSKRCDFNDTVQTEYGAATGREQHRIPCSAVTPVAEEMRAEGTRPQSRAALKKEIIENNIYGVDIERGAIDIARLRFWLSIVVDAERPEPLPNFDYKFMQGNSLIESYDGHDLSHIMESGSRSLPGRGARRAGWAENQTGIEFGSEEVKQNLRNWLKIYFSLTDHKEKAYYRELINCSVKNYIVQQGIGPAAETRLNIIDPSANKDFFLWHTWFKDIFDNGGFDIVIGNPPYKIVEKDDENKPFYDEHYAVAHGGKRNLYHLFFEKGINIAQCNGVLSYITPDTYFSGNDTSFLRKYLVENTSIKSIIHYTEKDKIFENVTQAVAVIVLTKHQPGQDFTIFSHGNSATIKYGFLDKANGWIFKASNSIIEKMKLCITTFDNVCIGYKGDVNLGLKKTFFLTTPKTNSLPLVRGVQLNKFSYVKGNEYCLKQALSKDQTSRQRIVFQEVANMGLKHRVKGTVLSDVICGDSCNIIFPKDDSIDIMYMLGILNSKAVNYFFKYFNQTNHVPIGELKKIPFPVINKDEQQPIVYLTKRILDLKDKDPNADTTSLEHEIDKLVYQLYTITPEEIAIIEQ